jgi:hypothetical protein
MLSRLQPTPDCHRLQPVVTGGQDDTEPASAGLRVKVSTGIKDEDRLKT